MSEVPKVTRRLYRRSVGSSEYHFIADLEDNVTTYIDPAHGFVISGIPDGKA